MEASDSQQTSLSGERKYAIYKLRAPDVVTVTPDCDE
jgi:hypothetical protein